MAKTEKILSNLLKQSLPKKTFFQRIENRVGEGIPDTFICMNGNVYFIELKIIKNNRIIPQKSQIAWHISYDRSNGISFFLASSPKERCLFLFEGGKALEIAKNNNYNHIVIPGGLPPRAAFGLSFPPIFKMLAHYNMISDDYFKMLKLYH